MRTWIWIIVAVVAAWLAVSCASFGDFADDDPRLSESAPAFDGDFLVASDVDMPGTGYADGRLERIDGATDEVALVRSGRIAARVPVSSSVIAWSQVLDISPDGVLAAAVETRGVPPAQTQKYENVSRDFPRGTRLTTMKVGALSLEVADVKDIGVNLGTVEFVGPRLVLIASETPDGQIMVVRIADDGRIGEIWKFALTPPYLEGDVEKHVRTAHVSPDGRTIAANISNKHVQFYRLVVDSDGAPTAVQPMGLPFHSLGRRLSIGKWTPDGRFFVITDTNGGSGLGPLLTEPGQLNVLRPPADDSSSPALVGRAKVGWFPEGFDISPNGRAVASINLERTYLPEEFFLQAWPGRRQYSISLLSLDPETGELKEIDRIKQSGILPEDIIFDRSGRNLATVVFHRRNGPDRRSGFVDYFSIGENAKLKSQGVTLRLARGPNDLVLLP